MRGPVPRDTDTSTLRNVHVTPPNGRLTEEVVALHDPVSGVVVGGADDAGPGHVGARGGGGRGAVLLPGREGAHIVVLHTPK